MRSYTSLALWALQCLWLLSACAVYEPLCLRAADRKPAEYFPLPDNEGGWRTATNASKARNLAGIRAPFHEGSMGGDDGIRRVLEMVVAAVETP